MSSVNKVILIGHLGKDPEVRNFPNGGQVASFSVATSETWKDKQSGERKEKTEWHNVSIFTDVVLHGFGSTLVMLDGKPEGGASRDEDNYKRPPASTGTNTRADIDDDIPF